jgi:hypothetical protein
MGWLTDPQIWASQVTLTALEIVLGIDKLVFIAIVAGRLPPERQNRARRVGLALALITRLALLASIVWIIGLTRPVFDVFGQPVFWRDIVLIAGGLFLLYKGTREIHHGLEGDGHKREAEGGQHAFLAMLASGWSPVYPCHVPPREMRQHPIGTGPFQFAEFRPNEVIQVTRNPDYWKAGRPYLDGIEWTIIKDLSTRTLAFIAGKGDLLYGVTIPQVKDVKTQATQAICDEFAGGVNRNLLVNRDKPPFNNPELRRAMSLSLDRQAFIDILYGGKGRIGGAMQPPPDGLWGMPADVLQMLPGYGPDIEKNRTEARELMQKAGYGPDNRLKLQVSTRNVSYYRDPAVISDRDRPTKADIHRRRTRHRRHGQLVSKSHAQGLHRRDEYPRERGRRPGPAILRELCVPCAAQLYRLLQSASRQAGRPAIDGIRCRATQEAGLGDRKEAGGR